MSSRSWMTHRWRMVCICSCISVEPSGYPFTHLRKGMCWPHHMRLPLFIHGFSFTKVMSTSSYLAFPNPSHTIIDHSGGKRYHVVRATRPSAPPTGTRTLSYHTNSHGSHLYTHLNRQKIFLTTKGDI
ncbi:hypothetical protein GE21DRAFT_1347527 [Neurospora crassa]|nr:hypothetical protein GE21DRAFT_1347527 [Neurospora crassa]